jgi:hypothetical protein
VFGYNRQCELRRCPPWWQGDSGDVGPVIPIRRVVHSLRTASGRADGMDSFVGLGLLHGAIRCGLRQALVDVTLPADAQGPVDTSGAHRIVSLTICGKCILACIRWIGHMAASIYVAENFRATRANPSERSVWLDDTGCYWHLYRYFEGAKVQRAEELIDLYGGAEIDGYELDRLEDELMAAREDANRKPNDWKVLRNSAQISAQQCGLLIGPNYIVPFAMEV